MSGPVGDESRQSKASPDQSKTSRVHSNVSPFGDLQDNDFDLGLNFGDGDQALESFDFDSFLNPPDTDGNPFLSLDSTNAA